MKRISFFLLIATALLLQSCIKEDAHPCKSELLLRFRYTLNNAFANLFGQEVRRVTVFLFDSNGKYVDRFSEEGSLLTNDYVMHLAVPSGKYSVVVCGGDFTTYTASELNNTTGVLYPELRKGITSLVDFRIELKNRTDADDYLLPANTPDDLYTGWAPVVLSSTNATVTDVELMKDTKKVRIRITGTASFVEPFDVFITAVNGRYRHDNSIDPNQGVFKYTPLNTVNTSNVQESNLKGMRLMMGLSPVLIIKKKNSPEVLYSKNMIELILATGKYSTQEDIDREDEFVIDIALVNGMLIAVAINGWKINNINAGTE